MKKFRNPYEENEKAIIRYEMHLTRTVGAISPTPEGSGRYLSGSKETKEDKENKN